MLIFLKIATLITYAACNLNIGPEGDASQFTPSLGDTSPGSVWPQPQAMQSTSVVSVCT